MVRDKFGQMDFNSTWGGMAQKFLKQLESGKDMGGYINSDLAEVHTAQEHGINKIELQSRPFAQTDWVAMLTADYQKNWPYLWFVVRKWCAFKLLPPFPFVNGKPAFIAALDLPGNEIPKDNCATLVNGCPESWTALAELMRFDSRTGQSPVVDFLIAQKIVGKKLLKLYHDHAGSNTHEFRRVIYREMSLHQSGDASFIPAPRGGDSELIAAGHLALSGEYVWEELRGVAKQFSVGKGMPQPNRCVAVDCGYAEKFNREVLRKCYESATVYKFYDPMSRNRPALFYRQPIHNYCQPCPA
ncbi:MAG TPA: hypothetical protein VII37_06280, partial [Candidatus Acidoferrum sp.]